MVKFPRGLKVSGNFRKFLMFKNFRFWATHMPVLGTNPSSYNLKGILTGTYVQSNPRTYRAFVTIQSSGYPGISVSYPEDILRIQDNPG